MVVLTNFPPPSEGIRHQQTNTEVLMNEKSLGKGTLYIAESRVSWVNGSSGEGFSLEYPHICLHAISRTPVECLYMMVDSGITPKLGDEDDDSKDDENESDEDGNDEESESTVMKFLPEDLTALDAMYQAMSQCQALNPDPKDVDSDPENIFVDADGEEGGEEDDCEDQDDDGEDYEEATNGDEGSGMEVDATQFEDADSDVDN